MRKKIQHLFSIVYDLDVQFLVVLSVLPQSIWKKRLNSTGSSKQTEQLFLPNRPRQNRQRGKKLNKFCPPIRSEDLCLALCFHPSSMCGGLGCSNTNQKQHHSTFSVQLYRVLYTSSFSTSNNKIYVAAAMYSNITVYEQTEKFLRISSFLYYLFVYFRSGSGKSTIVMGLMRMAKTIQEIIKIPEQFF